MAASTSAPSAGGDEGEASVQMGLVPGHTYSVIEVITVEDAITYKMLRVSSKPTPRSRCPRVFCSWFAVAGRCATHGARLSGPATGATTRPSGTRTRRSRRPAVPRARWRATASSGCTRFWGTCFCILPRISHFTVGREWADFQKHFQNIDICLSIFNPEWPPPEWPQPKCASRMFCCCGRPPRARAGAGPSSRSRGRSAGPSHNKPKPEPEPEPEPQESARYQVASC